MADSTIAIDEPVTIDKLLDCESLVVAGQTVQRERMRVAGALDIELARVANVAPGAGDYGLVVRTIPSGTQVVSAVGFDIRPLVKATDGVYAVLKTDAGVAYDARDRSWVITEAVDVSDRVGRVLGQLTDGVAAYVAAKTGQLPTVLTGGGNLKVAIVESTATVTDDVTDRDARLLGRAKILDSAGALIDPALKGQLPASLGQKAMAASLAVVVASDQSGIPVIGDVDHDAVNTAKVIQVGGHASASDVPPTLVSAVGDRTRNWVDRAGAQIMRRRKLRETYTAVCRLAETAARMDPTFTHTANVNKQLVTFHHAATATREIRIQKVVVFATLLGTAAGFWDLELRAITGTPATGNPAITPKAHRLDAAATEGVCLVLPTTAGTDATPNSPYGLFVVDHGIEVTTQATAHPLPQGLTGGYPFVLYDASAEDDEMLPIILRAGILEGIAINSRDTAAMVLRFWAIIKYTEEAV